MPSCHCAWRGFGVFAVLVSRNSWQLRRQPFLSDLVSCKIMARFGLMVMMSDGRSNMIA